MMQNTAHNLTESGLLPDAVVRTGIRHLLKDRLREIAADDIEQASDREQALLELMAQGHVAEVPELANAQHYEVPAEFFSRVLGKHNKYSCAYWPEGVESLDQAESAALAMTVERAQIRNGQRILELGCGWGSLSLYMAEHFPLSKIVAVSNSSSQARYIRDCAARRKLHNLDVITADMNDFVADGHFDRVVSVEMFEHMRNWEALFARVSNWLLPEGMLFMHIFVHRSTPYLFEDKGPSDWMSRHFFSGGMMPSADLPLRIKSELIPEQRWFWSGLHYARTCNAWLEKMDSQKTALKPLFEETYGRDFAAIWWQRWRMFFMACAELFAYRHGQEWFVGHYLFRKGDAA
jgi:cyclopropane-fatty-acyl-phospholipid synthase